MRQRGLSAKSCNDYIAGMNSFFKWLRENEYVKELFKIQRMKEEKKVSRSFSDEELKRIINRRPKSFSQVRLRAILLTLIDAGRRIDELPTRARENTDFDNLLIKAGGKEMKERIIPTKETNRGQSRRKRRANNASGRTARR
jgi:site-specific recombinase XerD